MCLEQDRLRSALEETEQQWVEAREHEVLSYRDVQDQLRLSLIRQDALGGRNEAAKRLYAHRMAYAICKTNPGA
jgi:hypothetical protein